MSTGQTLGIIAVTVFAIAFTGGFILMAKAVANRKRRP